MTDFETHPVGTTAMIKCFWEEFDAKDKRIAELEADLAGAEARVKLLEAVMMECQEALRDYLKQYPHMAKGYMIDAEKNARAAFAQGGAA